MLAQAQGGWRLLLMVLTSRFSLHIQCSESKILQKFLCITSLIPELGLRKKLNSTTFHPCLSVSIPHLLLGALKWFRQVPLFSSTQWSISQFTLNNNKRTQNQGIQHNNSTETRYFDRAVINAVKIRCYLHHLMTMNKTVEMLMIFFHCNDLFFLKWANFIS